MDNLRKSSGARPISIILSSFILLIIYILSGGLKSISYSIKNVMWLKDITSMGPDYKLFYPFGACIEVPKKTSLLEKNINEPASPYLAGLAALHVNNFSTAESILQKAIEDGIFSKSSRIALGVVYYLNGRDPIPLWQQSDYSTRLLMVGKECIVAGELDLASTYYSFALDTMIPNNSTGYKQIVEFYAGTQDQERFNKALQSYLELADPNSVEYHWTLGNIAFTRKEYSQARDHFQFVINAKPDDAFALYSLGQALVFLNEYDQARIVLLKAIEINPKIEYFYVYMGHSYLHQQNYNDAGLWYEKALQINPKSVWAMTHLVDVKIQQKQYIEAFSLITKAMELNQKAYIRAKAAEVALLMGDIDNALLNINQAINLEPDNISFYNQQAAICEVIDDNECMKSSYLNIFRINPNDEKNIQKLNILNGKNP